MPGFSLHLRQLPHTHPSMGGHPISQDLQRCHSTGAKLVQVALALSFPHQQKMPRAEYVERPQLPARQGGSASGGDRKGQDEGMMLCLCRIAVLTPRKHAFVCGRSHITVCTGVGNGCSKAFQMVFKFCLFSTCLLSETRRLAACRREGARRWLRFKCV